MDLTTLIRPETVKLPLEAFDKEEALAELLELLVRTGTVADRDDALDALLARETRGSTGIGGGVAIPHAKLEGMEGVALAVGVSPDGIEFESMDHEPVHVIFMVMAGVHDAGPNVELLAEIGHLMQVPGVYEQILKARGVADLLQIVESVQVDSE